jgi:hypothetical protein
MAAPGLRLSILAGPTVPLPLPAAFTTRWRSARVTETDEERSAFTLTFDAGRSGPGAALDSPMLTSPVVTGARVVLVVTFGVVPSVLMDGIVTSVELTPGDEPGAATYTATGEDVSLLLDRVEKDAEWPALDDQPQALAVLAPYAAQGIVPLVIPPADLDPPLPIERIPTQHDTDLRHLTALAARHGYVAYVIPGPAPGTSTFYWGPPVRAGVPQPAITVDLGPQTNVVAPPRFRTDALAPVRVEGSVQDPRTGITTPVLTPASLRPPLAAAQAEMDRSVDAVVAEGELDGARYGAVLRPRGLVGLRGAGWSHDGLWYVRRVVHDLAPGSYGQAFTLARDGYGATTPVVLP